MLTSIECVFLDFWDARGLGLLFVVCACAVGLRGNRLTGMRGTWGVVWRSAHVPTIPFTWLRRANAWTPSAHASNYQALLSIKLCQECGFNSCVRVFFILWGHVSNHAHIWAFVTSISHMGEMRESDWSRQIVLRSDWLPPNVAICTTKALISSTSSSLACTAATTASASGFSGSWAMVEESETRKEYKVQLEARNAAENAQLAST